MTTLLELDLASRLKKAEDRWLAQCDERLRRAVPDADRPQSETQETDR